MSGIYAHQKRRDGAAPRAANTAIGEEKASMFSLNRQDLQQAALDLGERDTHNRDAGRGDQAVVQAASEQRPPNDVINTMLSDADGVYGGGNGSEEDCAGTYHYFAENTALAYPMYHHAAQ